MTPAARLRRRPPSESGDFPDSIPPLLRRIYAARGATDAALAQPKLTQLLPPDGLLGLERATELLAEAIAAQRHILVVGDFDCDGATACAVGVRGLRMLGAQRVSHAVPNRIVHGYGLSPALVEELAPLQPDLLVTVDHGIACHAGIAAARARGWQVLVTDHHLPGERLPEADAIVDPNQPGDGFPSKMLAGVGVMFYVLLALRRRLREAGAFADGKGPDLSALLDLVAVGTVADLVPLDTNNRALVAAGLRRLRAGQGCAGLRALIEVSQRDYRRLTAADIGYAVGPRLNAAGRLEDMALGIECLLTDDAGQAREIAATLNEINAERRAVQQQMTDEAQSAFARVVLDAASAPLAVCLYDADWHPGVVGLVASKMKERLHRPAIAFAPAEPGSDQLRGSARSIPGFHIRDALADVAAQHPELIERFGGHAMAAGLSLRREAFDAFRVAFEACAQRLLTPELLQADILSDGELQPAEFDRRHAECLRDGGPWGQGFPEPTFHAHCEVLNHRVLGEKHLKLTLRVEGRAEPLNAIQFNGWDGAPPPKHIHVAFRLEPDDYRGGDAIQLNIVYRESL